MGRDSFYTPTVLADKLVSFIHKENFESVADFCVGDGELLRAARAKWPNIKCYGSDISKEAIQVTKDTHKDWQISQMDFLDSHQRENSRIIRIQRFYDLILLNPPFSCVGGTVHTVEFDNETYAVSTAMKFLVTALNYLTADGVLYAILPTSVAYSQKDKKLWHVLERKHNLSILEEPKVQYFKNCTPNVVLVSVNDFSQQSKYKNVTRISLEFENLTVFRGKISMDQINNQDNGNRHLVHSTNINNNQITNLSIKVSKPNSEVNGPGILLPRVGKPNSSKMCVIEKDDTYIISDCVIAIKTSTLKDARLLYNYLTNNWDLMEDMYK